MRKDSINSKAIEQAYLIYSEHGHKIVDYDQSYSNKPTDYKRGTVEEPEHTSKLRDAYRELMPASVMDGGRYAIMRQESEALNLRIDEMQNQMRISRQRGAFQMLQNQMKEMQKLIKDKEALDARMAVEDLGKKQMGDYNRTMEQETSYSELSELTDRISALETMIESYLAQSNYAEVEVEIEVKGKGKKEEDEEDEEEDEDED